MYFSISEQYHADDVSTEKNQKTKRRAFGPTYATDASQPFMPVIPVMPLMSLTALTPLMPTGATHATDVSHAH